MRPYRSGREPALLGETPCPRTSRGQFVTRHAVPTGRVVTPRHDGVDDGRANRKGVRHPIGGVRAVCELRRIQEPWTPTSRGGTPQPSAALSQDSEQHRTYATAQLKPDRYRPSPRAVQVLSPPEQVPSSPVQVLSPPVQVLSSSSTAPLPEVGRGAVAASGSRLTPSSTSGRRRRPRCRRAPPSCGRRPRWP